MPARAQDKSTDLAIVVNKASKLEDVSLSHIQKYFKADETKRLTSASRRCEKIASETAGAISYIRTSELDDSVSAQGRRRQPRRGWIQI